jgi:multidrug efflux pump subunit AcrA (membrane-fusion protein)
VKQGDKLFELDTTQLREKLIQAQNEALSYERQRQKAMGEASGNITPESRAKVSEANIAAAQRDAAQAQASQLQLDIDRSVVKSDIDGEVLEGDLKDKKSAPVKLGDQLMIVGQPHNLRGEIRVAERDVQDVHPGAKGKLAITSLPQEKYPFTVERVVPNAEVKENTSYFKVIVKLDDSAKIWMPGMEGEARVDVAPASLGWKWTHRLVDFVRLKLWI